MISVEEAKKIINENASVLSTALLPLYQSTGYIITDDIYSQYNIPTFNQSAMDGYAFNFEAFVENKILKINGEIPAGETLKTVLKKDDAVRIFTGSMVPEPLDTVVMQEKVTVINNELFITDNDIKKGVNIRLKGSQTQKGDLALKKGTLITPAVSGFLAGLGISSVEVFKFPLVRIINTGKELTPPGQKLEDGKVFECNSYSLNSALNLKNIIPESIESVIDDELKITDCIKKNLSKCDILIVTGGVSVGDYDFVTKALNNCGVQCLFHKVKQKPGKPLYFGKYKNTLVFGLPGNPASVLSCFYNYVLHAINTLTGNEIANNQSHHYPLMEDYSKKPGLTYFLKGKIEGNKVKLLHAQESFQMGSFADADCLVQLDENKTDYYKGDLVKVKILYQF